MFNFSSLIDHLEFLKMRDKKVMMLLSICTITLPIVLSCIKFIRRKTYKSNKRDNTEGDRSEKKYSSNCLQMHPNQENSPLDAISYEDEIRENKWNEHCLLPNFNPMYNVNAVFNESRDSSYVSDIEVARGISSGDSDSDVHILDESSNSESQLQKRRRKKTHTSESQSSFRESQTSTPTDERRHRIDISISDCSVTLDISGPPMLEVMEMPDPYYPVLSDSQLQIAPELLLEEPTYLGAKSNWSKPSETSSSTIIYPVSDEYRDSETGEKSNLSATCAKSSSKLSDVHLQKHASVGAEESTQTEQRSSSPESSDESSLNLVPSPTNERKFYSTDAAGHITVYQDLSDDEFLEEDRILGNKGKMAESSMHIYRKRTSKKKSTQPRSDSIETESNLAKDVGKEKMPQSKKYRKRIRDNKFRSSNQSSTSLAPISIPLQSFTHLKQPILMEEKQNTVSATQNVLDESSDNSDVDKLKQGFSPDTSSKNGSSSESSLICLETMSENPPRKTFQIISDIQKDDLEISTSEETPVVSSEESKSAHSVLELKQKFEFWESNFMKSKIKFSKPPEDENSEFQDSDSLLVSQQAIEPRETELNNSSSSNIKATGTSANCPLPSFTFFNRLPFNEAIEDPDSIKSNPENAEEKLKDVFSDTNSKNSSNSDSAVVYLETVPLTKLKDTDPTSDRKKCEDATSAREETKTSEELKKRAHSSEAEGYKKQKVTEIESTEIQLQIGLSNTPALEPELENSPDVIEILQEVAVPPRLVELIDDNIDNSDSSHTEAVIQFLTKDMDKPSSHDAS